MAHVSAVKIWKSERTKEGSFLTIHADDITMADGFKGSSSADNTLARVLALEFGDSTHRPAHRKHLASVCNNVTDDLSRRLQPGVSFRVLDLLKDIKNTELPIRQLSYYLAKA